MPGSTANGEVTGAVSATSPVHPSSERAPEDLRLALRAATMHYLDGLTQAEIAQRLGVSRPTAGRLVARAKSKGLVRIEVVVPPDLRDDLHTEEERALEQRSALEQDASVGRAQMHVFGPAGTVILQCWLCGPCRPAPADVTATTGVLAERILRWYRSNPDLWPTLRLSGNG